MAEFDDFILEASEMYVPFAKGAQLIFERTHAFYSIDVDSHTSIAPLQELNKQAAVLIAKEIITRKKVCVKACQKALVFTRLSIELKTSNGEGKISSAFINFETKTHAAKITRTERI